MPPKLPHRQKRRPSPSAGKRQPPSKGTGPRSSKPKPRLSPPSGPQRLQKVLAAAGLGSRRQCEELITAGRVDVDRRVVTELGTRVDPAKQAIRVDGVALHTARLEYFAVNKPSGVLCTNRDPSGRTRVIDLLGDKHARLFTIGRLDLHSEGLILVTNDGELANRLTHPRYGVRKTYRVVVAGNPTREVLTKLESGVHLAEGFARAERMEIRSHHKESTTLEMVLREGKNREIRRLLARVGHKVLRLTRIAVGPIRLGSLPTGAVRRLMPDEVKALKREGAAAGRDRVRGEGRGTRGEGRGARDEH
jgi:23S rRNA pseudouridine2605 synthase